MKKIISVILCVSIFFTFSTTSYAVTNGSTTLDEILTEKIVNLKEKGDRLYLDRNGIEIGLYNNEAGKIRLVDGNNAIEATTVIDEIPEKTFAKRNSVKFNYEKSGIKENVKILKEEYGGEFYDVISDTFLIEKAELNCIAKEYKLPGNWEITTSNDMKDSVKFISDLEGNIICSIEEAVAIDANGDIVSISETISNNSIIYNIDNIESVKFPIVVELRSHPVKYVTDKLIAGNNNEDRANLHTAAQNFLSISNNSVSAFISAILTAFSFFNTTAAVASLFFGSAIANYLSYYQNCHDVYEAALSHLFNPDCRYVTITHTYRGTWQGQNKEYVYAPTSVTEVPVYR